MSLHAHLLFELMAYSGAFRYYVWLRRHRADPISDAHRLWIFIGAAAGGLVGSRVLGLFEDPRLWVAAPPAAPWLAHAGWLAYLNSKTIVGGFLGGLIGVECTKKCLGVTASSGDLMVYPLVAGTAVGRIGCFLAGVTDGTHGIPCTGWLCLDLGDGIARHPAALYEIVFVALLGLGIYGLERRHPLANGMRFRLFLAFYLLFRFFIEFIKPVYRFEFGLSAIQMACLAGLAYYYRVFLFPKEWAAPSEK